MSGMPAPDMLTDETRAAMARSLPKWGVSSFFTHLVRWALWITLALLFLGYRISLSSPFLGIVVGAVGGIFLGIRWTVFYLLEMRRHGSA